jgi:cytochrome c-type biogenesis protein CcmH/NrfG
MKILFIISILVLISVSLAVSEDDNMTVPIWMEIGGALLNQSTYDEAINAFDEAIKLDPKFVQAWNSKGDALRWQGEYDDAIKAYDEAIRLDPKNINAWINKTSITIPK